MGLFGTAEGLKAAIAELGDRRLKPSQIRLIAPARALDGALDAWLSTGDIGALGASIVCRPMEGPFPWSLTMAGTADAAPMRAPTSAPIMEDVRVLLELRHWALRRQAEQLDRHLRAGGALLQVEPNTDAEEQAACTALLRHASGGVQTHEIARPPSRAGI